MRARLRSLLPSTAGILSSETQQLFCFSCVQQTFTRTFAVCSKPLVPLDQQQHHSYSHLQSLCQQGLLQAALLCLEHLPSPASHNAYLSLLKACHRKKSLPHTYVLLTHLVVHSLDLCGFLGEHSVVALVKCDALDDALQVFCRLPCHTAFSWTAIISGFTDRGHNHKALCMYLHMQNERVEPDRYTVVSLFKACGNISELEVGRLVHGTARRKGFASDPHAATTMVSMYGKCGAIKEAENVFVSIVCRDSILWNALLSAYVQGGQAEKALQLFKQMHREGISPDKQTLVIALQACGYLATKEDWSNSVDTRHLSKLKLLEIGRALHADARHKGFLLDMSVSSTLVSMYGKCGASHEAEVTFQELGSMEIVPCTAMLSAYIDGNEKDKALKLYRQMELEGTTPSQQTLVCALRACDVCENNICLKGYSSFQEFVKAIHADALRRGQASDLFVSNSLISMYGKCGSMQEAEGVFDRLLNPDVVSWTALLSIFVDLGYGRKALQLYREMHVRGVSPNYHTVCVALQGCVVLLDEEAANHLVDGKPAKSTPLEVARALHVDVERNGFAAEVVVATALVTVYGKCGSIFEAEDVFRGWQGSSSVLRNAMLSVYVNHGQGCKALDVYKHTRSQKDVCTLVCVLQACSDIGTIDTALELHFDIVSATLEHDTFLASVLIHAYGRNACVVDAEASAYGLSQPGVVSWNACMSGYAGEGQCIGGLQVFEEMQLAGFEPNEVSFTSLFSACSHAGFTEDGLCYFESMRGYCKISPELKHYINMVDLLGRAGEFNKVRDLLQNPSLQDDVDIWSCVLGACCTHRNPQLGRLAFHHIVNLHPQPDAAYVLMLNMPADSKLQV